MNGTEIKIRIDKDTVLTRVLPNSEISVADILGLAQSLKPFFRMETSSIDGTPLVKRQYKKSKKRKEKHFHTLEEIQEAWKKYNELKDATIQEKNEFATGVGYKDWYSFKGRIDYWLSKNRIERRN